MATLTEAVLGGVLLVLIAVGVFIYSQNKKLQVAPPKPIKIVEKIHETGFMDVYPGVMAGLTDVRNRTRQLFENNLVLRLDELYVKARFHPEAITELRGLLVEIESKVIEIGKIAREQDTACEKLKTLVESVPKRQKDYAENTVSYMIDANRKYFESMAYLIELSNLLSFGMDDLEKNGPRMSSEYIKIDTQGKRAYYGGVILEKMEGAEKFYALSQVEASKIVPV